MRTYAERFVRSIKEECLDRLTPMGERHFRRAVEEYVEHYHRERNHQGLGKALIVGAPPSGTAGRVRRRPRLGGLLKFLRAGGVIVRSAEKWNIRVHVRLWDMSSLFPAHPSLVSIPDLQDITPLVDRTIDRKPRPKTRDW